MILSPPCSRWEDGRDCVPRVPRLISHPQPGTLLSLGDPILVAAALHPHARQLRRELWLCGGLKGQNACGGEEPVSDKAVQAAGGRFERIGA